MPDNTTSQEHTTNPLAALALAPVKTFMEVQDKGENVELLIRKHPAVNVPWMIGTVLLAAVPTLLFSPFGLEYLGVSGIIEVVSEKTVNMFILLWYLFVFYYGLQNAILWFFNVLIVTNERVVDLDVTWPFHRAVSETRISQVQDVSFKQGGFLASILNYGGIYIQTAGIEQNIEIRKAPNPALIHDKITDLVAANERGNDV
ncbi:PH domain-containing protein [candidate division WWE3 bacterium]|uniref:PH domain-containing protein n=1 Tax=candidate division WWE3 bacterium TaxID=2053526 RepID=A0A955LH48_UNCKA|nr:PH domain-containing protein [candidate division WWE3 bacterium]